MDKGIILIMIGIAGVAMIFVGIGVGFLINNWSEISKDFYIIGDVFWALPWYAKLVAIGAMICTTLGVFGMINEMIYGSLSHTKELRVSAIPISIFAITIAITIVSFLIVIMGYMCLGPQILANIYEKCNHLSPLP